MSKLTIPTTDRRPVAITEAEQEIQRFATEVAKAKADLALAEQAHQGAADARSSPPSRLSERASPRRPLGNLSRSCPAPP